MGYLSGGRLINFEDYGKELNVLIAKEYKDLFRMRFGWNWTPSRERQLSSLELDRLLNEASRRVMAKRELMAKEDKGV